MRQIARLNTDGSVVPSFDTGTGFIEYVTSVALQPDGRLYKCSDCYALFNGQAVPDLVRLNSDGSLDPTFDVGSGPSDLGEVVAVQPDGKVLVGGQFHTFNGSASPFIVRLNADR
ncbi:MAG: delta-60 repeat domain-containing protein [Flavobacteriales bacterium]|nr:delta-60 repeat domain-containing protein [Flavobacteriales bacterium]